MLRCILHGLWTSQPQSPCCSCAVTKAGSERTPRANEQTGGLSRRGHVSALPRAGSKSSRRRTRTATGYRHVRTRTRSRTTSSSQELVSWELLSHRPWRWVHVETGPRVGPCGMWVLQQRRRRRLGMSRNDRTVGPARVVSRSRLGPVQDPAFGESGGANPAPVLAGGHQMRPGHAITHASTCPSTKDLAMQPTSRLEFPSACYRFDRSSLPTAPAYLGPAHARPVPLERRRTVSTL